MLITNLLKSKIWICIDHSPAPAPVFSRVRVGRKEERGQTYIEQTVGQRVGNKKTSWPVHRGVFIFQKGGQ